MLKNWKESIRFCSLGWMPELHRENDEVFLAGLGKKGKSKGDIPGMRFKVFSVKGISL